MGNARFHGLAEASRRVSGPTRWFGFPAAWLSVGVVSVLDNLHGSRLLMMALSAALVQGAAWLLPGSTLLDGACIAWVALDTLAAQEPSTRDGEWFDERERQVFEAEFELAKARRALFLPPL